MPYELTVLAVSIVVGGLVTIVAALLRRPRSRPRTDLAMPAAPAGDPEEDRDHERVGQSTLRLVWWLTTATVLLGIGLSGAFEATRAAIFGIGAISVIGAILFHELRPLPDRFLVRAVELLVATALVAGLLLVTGYAASPFSALFALLAVAAALAHGPRAGLLAAGLATVAFGAVLLVDPSRLTYSASDALRLSIGIGTTWLLAFLAVAYAIRDRHRMARERHRARTDPLTGLLNRSQLFETVALEVSRTRRSDRGFCVLMIDVDGLKQVNDTAGHLAGDAAIRAIAMVIGSSIRLVDSAYRYGGDEFVVVLPETDIVGAFVVAEKIRLGAEELQVTTDAASDVSVSIGLVSHPEDGLNAEELMAAADRAMYQAKRQGKNQISGNPRPRTALLGRRTTTSDEPVAVAVVPGAVQAVATPAEGPVAPPATAPEPVGRAEAPAAGGQAPADAAVEPATTAPRETAPPETAPPTTGRPDVAAAPPPVIPLSGAPAPSPSAPAPAVPTPSAAPGAGVGVHGDEEDADPQEVRRQIAAARLAFDPDDQIRRAMDAFLSPIPDRDRRPDA